MTVYINDSYDNFIDAFESINSQTIPPDKIIIVSDGPICYKIKIFLEREKISNKKLIFLELNENIGLGKALAHGLEHVDTDLVMRMDSDDVCLLNRADILLQAMFREKVSVVGSYILEFVESINEKGNLIKYSSYPTTENIFNYTRDPVGHASVMFRKKDVDDAGGYLHCMSFEDTYLWVRMAKMGFQFHNVSDPLYYARTDQYFYERRGGLSYLKIEILSFLRFYNEGLISYKSFFINILIRPFIRILPKKILSFVYKKLLRN